MRLPRWLTRKTVLSRLQAQLDQEQHTLIESRHWQESYAALERLAVTRIARLRRDIEALKQEQSK